MTTPLELPEKLDHAACAQLLKDIRARLNQPLVLDGCRVRGIGGLCAQVLLAAARAWAEEGHDFELRASEPMAADLERLGLDIEAAARGSAT